MKAANHTRGRLRIALLCALFGLSVVLVPSASAAPGEVKQAPIWKRSLPSSSCPWSSRDTYCHHASPLLADVSGDGKLDIVVATNRGHVQLYRHDGTLVWDTDIAPAFGMDRDRQRIASSPAAADVDADGRLEIIVGAGTVHREICTQGGVIVLEHDGSVKPGWPFLTYDYSIPPSGCRDSVFATPAVGDLDLDGDMEIVAGSFDKRLYALDHHGDLLQGFPPASYHFQRFGWENLSDRFGDTIWSSPALADLDGDGYLDIVTGTDEGNYDHRWQPVVGNWNCPYRSPQTQGYCGGSIYVFDRFGSLIPGFPRYQYEIIQSTPALIDIDGDNRAEMFVGTGDYYYFNSPDEPVNGFRLHGLDSDGRDLPGWSGGRRVGGPVTSSPALGDIDGDNIPEVVVTARDKKLYAFHLDGSEVPGFPMTPRAFIGTALDSYGVGSTVILADYTGDETMEIFVRHAWETIIVDGTGKQLTAASHGDSKPAYVTEGSLWNSPAVGDLDGDGHLELVSQNSELMVWRLPNSSDKAHWPMLKQNAQRTSTPGFDISFQPETIFAVHDQGQSKTYHFKINVSSYFGLFDWNLKSGAPTISFPKPSGTTMGRASLEVQVRVEEDLPPGNKRMGNIDLTVSRNGLVYESVRIPVFIRIFDELHQVYLPLAA